MGKRPYHRRSGQCRNHVYILFLWRARGIKKLDGNCCRERKVTRAPERCQNEITEYAHGTRFGKVVVVGGPIAEPRILVGVEDMQHQVGQPYP
ncbi:hypothetical protein D3C87_1711730 [compost metagenome]